MNHKRQVKEKLGHVARGTNSRLPFDLVQTRTQSPFSQRNTEEAI